MGAPVLASSVKSGTWTTASELTSIVRIYATIGSSIGSYTPGEIITLEDSSFEKQYADDFGIFTTNSNLRGYWINKPDSDGASELFLDRGGADNAGDGIYSIRSSYNAEMGDYDYISLNTGEGGTDQWLGTAYVVEQNSSKIGGAGNWDRFQGLTVGTFKGDTSGLWEVGIPLTFDATEHADTITGSSLSDVVYSLGGNDQIASGKGDDIICPGLGVDKMWSGTGEDIMTFLSKSDSGTKKKADAIIDFQTSEDKIDLSQITDSYSKVSFIGSSKLAKPISGNAQIRFGGGILQADWSGDGKSDFEIALTGVKTFLKDNLILA